MKEMLSLGYYDSNNDWDRFMLTVFSFALEKSFHVVDCFVATCHDMPSMCVQSTLTICISRYVAVWDALVCPSSTYNADIMDVFHCSYVFNRLQ
jgi:hypothetical protein